MTRFTRQYCIRCFTYSKTNQLVLTKQRSFIFPYNGHTKTGKPGVEKTEDDPKGVILLIRNHYKKCVDRLCKSLHVNIKTCTINSTSKIQLV